ncbi:MFS general substrate transporter [Zopfia rhizophila CBS 207.26]|uniref:MFS general substrate transporter n=1 Tax=Zopfia rhizophila CBS 207.26 TaxID=1314779 RepID=A0A6A6D7S8_9PEZI|nr:MFS general substrate transporter [Zopfia rhizophila CBS 207.26]
MNDKDAAGIVQEIDATHNAAEQGQVATDKYGHSLVQINPRVERKLRTKIDLYIVPTVALLYLFCFIDRANIGNARLAGFEKDLNLVGNDYNMVLSIFYISYTIFEIPATITCKWMGPGWFLPLTTLFFGITSVGTGFVQTRGQACALRFLLGIFEAGMMPGIAYYLSRWYCRAELAFRLGLYMVMAPLAGAFGGLLASGILKLGHFGTLHTWRMIFGIEGIITIGLATLAFFTLTDRPATARWLTEEEKDFAIARVKSERLAATVVLDQIDKQKLLRGVLNPITLSTAFIFLLNNITVLGISFFLPTIVKTIYPNRTTIEQQLLTVPPYVVGAFFVVLVPTISWYLDRRQIFLALSGPTVMAGYAMFLASMNAHVRYGAIFLTASSAFTLGAMANAQVSANVVSDTARSVAIGTNVMFGNIGGLIATWTFLPWDSPAYHIGNGLNLACSTMLVIVAMAALLWMKYDNKKRDSRSAEIQEELAGLTQQQIQDLDWKHPAFRWKL